MINNSDFAKRLQKVINFYGESASSFAEKIGVQRSSISHILSGRNKPSLEFVLKVLSSFPEVELYWLLNGKGIFPAEIKTEQKTESKPQNLFSNTETQKAEHLKEVFTKSSEKEIERIVIFYKDGSFSNFKNS